MNTFLARTGSNCTCLKNSHYHMGECNLGGGGGGGHAPAPPPLRSATEYSPLKNNVIEHKARCFIFAGSQPLPPPY